MTRRCAQRERAVAGTVGLWARVVRHAAVDRDVGHGLARPLDHADPVEGDAGPSDERAAGLEDEIRRSLGPIHRQGDSRPARRARLPAPARGAPGRPRPARARCPHAGVGERGDLPQRPLPRSGRARPGDALDGRGYGGGATPGEAYARALRAASRAASGGRIGAPLPLLPSQ